MRKKIIFAVVMIICLLSILILPSSFSLLRESAVVDGTVPLAEWNVSLEQTGVNNSLSIVPNGTTANYMLNVKSLSEVDVTYAIMISNLPSGVEVEIDDDGVSRPQDSNNTITIQNAGTVLYGGTGTTKTHKLTFKAVTGATVVNNQLVHIDVLARQVL